MEFTRICYIFVLFIATWARDLSNLKRFKDFNTVKTVDNGMYPWTISVKVADDVVNSFFGGLELDVVFKDFSQFSVNLPQQEFARGTKYSFNVQLGSTSQLQYAVMRTVGICSKSIPVNVMHLDWVQFQYDTTKSSYVKKLNNAGIKDKCQNVQGSVLTDFEEQVSSKKCKVNGQTYEHNEWFNMDCNARCRCVNGKEACVEMCPPLAWSPKANQTCREVNTVGKCCPSFACVNGKGQKITYLTRNRTSIDTTECKLKTVEKDQDDFTRAYPSLVFVCDEQCKRDKFNPAVIINNRWVMIHGDGSWNQANSFVHVTRPSMKPLRFKIEKAIKHEHENLILLQISENLPNTLQVQPVNLPVTKKHCENLMATGCSLINPSWKVGNENSVYTETQSLTLNKGEFTSRNLCNLAENAKSATCLALTPELCGKAINGPVFVSDGRLDFFLGMQSSDDKNINCQNRIIRPGVSICTTLDWIRTTTAN